MTDKEYYNYICSISNHMPDDISERDMAKLEKIIKKIDRKIKETSQRGRDSLFISYSIIDKIDNWYQSYPSIYIPKKYKRLLKCTLYNRLKNGGFRIVHSIDYTEICWMIKE